jgi:DNA-binding MarR family transcriptional regulator
MSVVASLPASSGAQRAGRFSKWFGQISRALSQQMVLYARREAGLNLAEYRALAMLAESRSASIRDIAAEVDLDKAQVTRAVAGLTRRGLTIHMVDGRDRRLRVVRLTPAGRAVIAGTLAFSVARQRRLEQTLTAAELRVMWKALAAIHREAQAMLANEAAIRPHSRRGRG